MRNNEDKHIWMLYVVSTSYPSYILEADSLSGLDHKGEFWVNIGQ